MKNRHDIFFTFLGCFMAVLGFLCSFSALSQTISVGPFTFQATVISQQIQLKAGATILADSINNLQTGDAIGAFYKDNNGQYICAGAMPWSNANLPKNIYVYGKDSLGNNGFSVGDTIYFKIWRSTSACMTEEVAVVYENGNTAGVFVPNQTLRIESFKGILADIRYGKTIFCKKDTTVSLLQKLPNSVWTTSNTLQINPNGSFYLNTAPAGNHTIFLTTDSVAGACLQRTQLNITITSFEPIFSIKTEAASCSTQKISVETDSVYQYQWNSGENTPSMIRSQDSWASVLLTNSQGCTFQSDSSWVTVRDTCLPQNTLSASQNVLTPDNAAGQPTLYIDCAAQIYDRVGRLVKNIYAPTDWNGTDNQLKILPSGLYIIVCENGTQKQVTIIR